MLLALNVEIKDLEQKIEQNKAIVVLKLKQLKRLSLAMVLQYVSVFLFLLSGIWNALFMDNQAVLFGLMLGAVFVITGSLVLLLIFSVKAVTIRQKHLGL